MPLGWGARKGKRGTSWGALVMVGVVVNEIHLSSYCIGMKFHEVFVALVPICLNSYSHPPCSNAGSCYFGFGQHFAVVRPFGDYCWMMWSETGACVYPCTYHICNPK